MFRIKGQLHSINTEMHLSMAYNKAFFNEKGRSMVFFAQPDPRFGNRMRYEFLRDALDLEPNNRARKLKHFLDRCWVTRRGAAKWLGHLDRDIPPWLRDNDDLTHTGFPGRPTLRHLVEGELNRRISGLRSGQTLGPNIKSVAESLLEWLKTTHGEKVTPKTIANNFRSIIREHMGRAQN